LPILYLSRYFIRHHLEYYRLLALVTSDATWEAWILYVLKGVEETANWTNRKIDAIRGLLFQTTELFRKEAPKIYSRELVDLLFELAYCRISDLRKEGLVGRQAASRYLQRLVGIGILKEVQSGREKLFINSGLMRLLTREHGE
jgi:Fic family protein